MAASDALALLAAALVKGASKAGIEVNHSINFKDPTIGAHINGMESSWRVIGQQDNIGNQPQQIPQPQPIFPPPPAFQAPLSHQDIMKM
uniref:Uncharacterized protein n=1 Tax=Romanomermis culicivorax TaxID=13658 RepID=A0A915IQB5_ROMCU